MKVYQYMHRSMMGTYWIPCEVIGVNEEGQLHIKYWDPLIDGPLEEEVDEEFIREAEPEVTDKYLVEAANYLAMKFKNDRIIMDEMELNGLADTIYKELQHYFNYVK